MLRELLSQHELRVFSDGAIEIHEIHPPIVKNAGDGDFKNCSSSMRQILLVIEFVFQYHKDHPDKNLYYALTTAIKYVASTEKVTDSTVHAKITRKLGLSMPDFREQLKIFITDGENNAFVQTLYASCVSRTRQADEAGIRKIVEKIKYKNK